MISQQLIIQCDRRMQCVIYISNKSPYGKTIDGVPLSFQEFFQIRQT